MANPQLQVYHYCSPSAWLLTEILVAEVAVAHNCLWHTCATFSALADAATAGDTGIIVITIHPRDLEASGALDRLATLRNAAPHATMIVDAQCFDAAEVASLLRLGVDDVIDTELMRKAAVNVPEAATISAMIDNIGKLYARKTASQKLRVESAGLRVAGATMQKIQARLPAILASAARAVHVFGASGTGKEVVAAMLRAEVSGEKAQPFLSLNCAAIPPDLVMSTLFGALQGAYTGATTSRMGIMEAASGGWLFLDEVGCLSREAQAALLRAIENQELYRVGATRATAIDVRILSASNQSLSTQVRRGRFRRDLWQRLVEVELLLPPLCERAAEIPEIIAALLRQLPGREYVVTAPAKQLLAALPWHDGNVRQLRNCLRAMTEHQLDGLLTPQAIPKNLLASLTRVTTSLSSQRRERRPDAAPGVLIPIVDQQGNALNFAQMSEFLFVEAVRHWQAHGYGSGVRLLAGRLGLSKSAVARRLAAPRFVPMTAASRTPAASLHKPHLRGQATERQPPVT